jgi:hypothetical protein
MKSTGRMEIERKEEGNTEIITNKIIRFDFDQKILDLLDIVFYDYDEAQNAGIFYDQDENCWIDVDSLLDALGNRMSDLKEDGEKISNELKLEKYFEQYKGYTIWV